jgi:hypothetical protein
MKYFSNLLSFLEAKQPFSNEKEIHIHSAIVPRTAKVTDSSV